MEESEILASAAYQRKNVAGAMMDDDTFDEGQRRRRMRRKKHQMREDYYFNDEEGEDEKLYGTGRRREEILPKWKLFLVGGAIFLCFALLYPSVFAPMLSNFWGGGRREEQPDRLVHPSMMGANPQRTDRPLPGRPPQPHPGASMRMPEQKQQSAGGFWGGRGGSFAWMLPFYTVGVICFLLYTLFNSKKKRQKRQRRLLSLLDDEEESEEEEDGLQAYGTRGAKLNSVQKRLRKTEQAMADILQQLESISMHSQQFKKQMESELKQEETNMEDVQQEGNSGQTTQSEGISAEQNAQVERSLRELKILSEMCKRDQRLSRKLGRKNHSSSQSSEEDEESSLDDEENEEGREEQYDDGDGRNNVDREEEKVQDLDISQTDEEEGGGGNDEEWNEAEEDEGEETKKNII